MESHKRSILKTVTWRLTATLVTSTIVYLFTREVALSIGIGSIDAIIKMFAYYGHERLWDRTEFGRKQKIKEDYMIQRRKIMTACRFNLLIPIIFP